MLPRKSKAVDLPVNDGLMTEEHPGPDGSWDVPLFETVPDPDSLPPDDLDVCSLCNDMGEIIVNPDTRDPQDLEVAPCPSCQP